MPGKALMDHLAKGLRTTQVGDWVTYKLDGGGARVHYWRLAVVGEEQDKLGRDALWLEMEWGTHPAMRAPLAQIRMLIARGDGVAFDPNASPGSSPPSGRPAPGDSQEALDGRSRSTSSRRPFRPPAGCSSPPWVRSGKETRR